MKWLLFMFFVCKLKAEYDVNIYASKNDTSNVEIIYNDKTYIINVKNKDLPNLDTKKLIKTIVNDNK